MNLIINYIKTKHGALSLSCLYIYISFDRILLNFLSNFEYE